MLITIAIVLRNFLLDVPRVILLLAALLYMALFLPYLLGV